MAISNLRACVALLALSALTAAHAQKQADIEINDALRIGKAIKAATKNPASFHLESFVIFDGGATCYEFRGTNSFNAIVPGRALYLPGRKEVLVQSAHGNRFIKAWNDTCTKPGGRERARGINALGAI